MLWSLLLLWSPVQGGVREHGRPRPNHLYFLRLWVFWFSFFFKQMEVLFLRFSLCMLVFLKFSEAARRSYDDLNNCKHMISCYYWYLSLRWPRAMYCLWNAVVRVFVLCGLNGFYFYYYYFFYFLFFCYINCFLGFSFWGFLWWRMQNITLRRWTPSMRQIFILRRINKGLWWLVKLSLLFACICFLLDLCCLFLCIDDYS